VFWVLAEEKKESMKVCEKEIAIPLSHLAACLLSPLLATLLSSFLLLFLLVSLSTAFSDEWLMIENPPVGGTMKEKKWRCPLFSSPLHPTFFLFFSF